MLLAAGDGSLSHAFSTASVEAVSGVLAVVGIFIAAYFYLMNRAAQKARRTFSGVIGVGVQDAAIQESMGPIANRPTEHLVATDKGIVMTRRRLLDAAAALAKGEQPPGLDPAVQRVRAMSRVTPRSMPVEEVLA